VFIAALILQQVISLVEYASILKCNRLEWMITSEMKADEAVLGVIGWRGA